MTVLKEAMFRDRAMDEIHRLLPRLYRFTKIPYAQCTLLNQSTFILREEEMKGESTYNVCFQWSQFAGEAPATQKPVLCRHLVLMLIRGKLFTLLKNSAPLHTREPARCFFAVSCRRCITVVYSHSLQSNPFNAFTSSCLAAQLSLQKK